MSSMGHLGISWDCSSLPVVYIQGLFSQPHINPSGLKEKNPQPAQGLIIDRFCTGIWSAY